MKLAAAVMMFPSAGPVFPAEIMRLLIPDYRTLMAVRCTCRGYTAMTCALPLRFVDYIGPSPFLPGEFVSSAGMTAKYGHGRHIYLGNNYFSSVDSLRSPELARAAILVDENMPVWYESCTVTGIEYVGGDTRFIPASPRDLLFIAAGAKDMPPIIAGDWAVRKHETTIHIYRRASVVLYLALGI